jgi:hypothetical protein
LQETGCIAMPMTFALLAPFAIAVAAFLVSPGIFLSSARMIVIKVFAPGCEPRWRPTPSRIDRRRSLYPITAISAPFAR